MFENHLQQTKKYLNKSNANGIVPIFCRHESLCPTVRELPLVQQRFHLANFQIIQVGHWTACPYVYPDWLLFGHQYNQGLQGAICLVTELVPNSFEALVELGLPNTCSTANAFCERNAFVWQVLKGHHQVVPCTSKWIPKFGSQVYAWPIQDYVFRQKPSRVPGSLAWHLLVPKQTYRYKPSAYFQVHDRDYWANNVDDTFCPSNKSELKKPPVQDLCQECCKALDGGFDQPKTDLLQTDLVANCKPDRKEEPIIAHQTDFKATIKAGLAPKLETNLKSDVGAELGAYLEPKDRNPFQENHPFESMPSPRTLCDLNFFLDRV